MSEESLSIKQIIELGKKIGSQINALPEDELFNPARQQTVKDAAQLALREILDPFDERVVPEEDA